MTLEAAVLSFYVLFPVWTDSQSAIALACDKVPSARERIAKEVSYVLDNPRLALSDVDSEIQKVGSLMQSLGLDAQEIHYTKDDGTLRLLSYGIEKTSLVSDISAGVMNNVSVNDKQFTQIVWDEHKRIKEKSVWRNAAVSSAVKMISKETYFYEFKDNPSIVSSVAKEFLSQDKASRTYYTINGRISDLRHYNITKKGWVMTIRERYQYDSSGRVSSLRETSYEKGGIETRTVYSYSENSRHPDTKYYEDGVLRIQTEYSDEEVYKVTTYFQKNFYIEAFYENGRKLKEVVYNNGKVQRTRTFE